MSRKMIQKIALTLALMLFVLFPALCEARVDKVYHPYVTPLEREIEWRLIFQQHRAEAVKTRQRHRFAFGASLSERFFLEAYMIADRVAGEDFELEGYELEGQLQLSEQGEFWADWGLLMELEREEGQDVWEAGLGLLVEKELGKWSLASNFISVYEFGSDLENFWVLEAASQLRYRLSAALEPALEIYWDKKNRGIGPALKGLRRIGFNKLKWEIGLIFTSGEDSRGQILRTLLEYEFY